jgi:non-ribosomal peptide synthetase component E (peptide arylation enzyme)
MELLSEQTLVLLLEPTLVFLCQRIDGALVRVAGAFVGAVVCAFVVAQQQEDCSSVILLEQMLVT